MGLSSFNAELCNGSTYDSDSYCLGSNPSSAAKNPVLMYGVLCCSSAVRYAADEAELNIRYYDVCDWMLVYMYANTVMAISRSFNCKENETNTIIHIEYDLLL